MRRAVSEQRKGDSNRRASQSRGEQFAKREQIKIRRTTGEQFEQLSKGKFKRQQQKREKEFESRKFRRTATGEQKSSWSRLEGGGGEQFDKGRKSSFESRGK